VVEWQTFIGFFTVYRFFAAARDLILRISRSFASNELFKSVVNSYKESILATKESINSEDEIDLSSMDDFLIL
jgi:hypothetical protein